MAKAKAKTNGRTQPARSREAASASGITPDIAKKILQADLARIVRKVKDGKPLSAAERNLMSQMADEGADGETVQRIEETPDHVPSVAALAGILGVSRRSIQMWRKRFPNEVPANRTNGSYDVAAWRAFVRRKGLKAGGVSAEGDDDDGDDIESLKKRDLRARAEEREFKVAILRGQYVHSDDVRDEIAALVAETIKMLRDKLENELPPVCAGMDAIGIREENARVVDEICELLHRGGERSVDPSAEDDGDDGDD